jgi:hypothetical protein
MRNPMEILFCNLWVKIYLNIGTTHSQNEDGHIQIFDDSDFKFI